MSDWLNSLAAQWDGSAVPGERWQKVLGWLLRDFAAETATVHRLDSGTRRHDGEAVKTLGGRMGRIECLDADASGIGKVVGVVYEHGC